MPLHVYFVRYRIFGGPTYINKRQLSTSTP